MAELTTDALSNCPIDKVSSKSCESESAPDGSAGNSPPYPLIYVRYKDHVIFKNILQPLPEVIERETVGWLTHEKQDILLIEHDRTVQKNGKGNGIIILRSCIVEIVPLQKISNWSLNRKESIEKGEYAFRPTERKTHSSKGEQKL